MKKKVLFTVLFISWISGIFLICLFPPIADFQQADAHLSFISQENAPELHQRNSSLTGVSQVDFGVEIFGGICGFQFNRIQKHRILFEKKEFLVQIPSFFNTRLLFKAFFETW